MTAEATRVGEPVIDVTELMRRFGSNTALDSVSLSMPRGAVYGLVGANGAGKTTLIKHVLGLLRAESGSVRVFGLDPVADPVGVLWHIGPIYCCWTNRRQASIPSFDATSSAPSSAPSRTKGAPSCFRRTCSKRWSRSPIT